MSKILTGVVVSTKTPMTIVVDVQTRYQHPRFKKIVKRHKKFKVHVLDTNAQIGDVVKIQQTRPISKDKHFILYTGKVTTETTKTETKKEVKAPVKKAEVKKTEVESAVKAPTARKTAKKTTKKAVKKTTTKKAKVTN
jgi:small subunit ribosomal protein S17